MTEPIFTHPDDAHYFASLGIAANEPCDTDGIVTKLTVEERVTPWGAGQLSHAIGLLHEARYYAHERVQSPFGIRWYQSEDAYRVEARNRVEKIIADIAARGTYAAVAQMVPGSGHYADERSAMTDEEYAVREAEELDRREAR